jgi:hypothetical protein
MAPMVFPFYCYRDVEFDTSKYNDVGDVHANHIEISVERLVSLVVANVSASKLVVNGGEKLKACVDYDVN